MKQFHSKLDELYEGLHLKKTYTEESKRPNFKIEDFILASVYDHIDKNILGFDWDFSDKEIVSDLMGQFKQIKNMIETRYETMNRTNIGDKERFHQQMAQQQAQEESFFLPRNSEEELENQRKMEDALVGIFDKIENVLYNQIVRQKDRLKQLGGDIQKLRIDPIIDGAENVMRRMLGLPEISDNDTTREQRNRMNSETKTAPDGHYYTKSGNLVKGRLSADAQERGARKSDPKDKQRSKTPPVSQYNT